MSRNVADKSVLPRILIIDDQAGRRVTTKNWESHVRKNICETFKLRDVSSDAVSNQKELDFIADVVFHRGQTPEAARAGDVVKNDLAGVLKVIRSGWDENLLPPGVLPWSLVLVDMLFATGRVTEDSERLFGGDGAPEGRMGDNDPYFGLTILEALHPDRKVFPDISELPIVALTGMSREELFGRTEELLVRAFVSRDDTQNSTRQLKELINYYKLVPDTAGKIIGCSKKLLIALRRARWVAQGSQDILLLGETGSGKNLLAKSIHQWSKRHTAPFKDVNCAAISPNLIESELFGHVKGAYTGAIADKDGFFLAANGGTLLIDEVGDMPSEVQVKLLSALESRTVTPVGSTEEKKFDTRVITATNAILEKLCNEGKFRNDLYYRIRPCLIEVPPLRDRKSDLPLLVEHIISAAGYPPRTIHPKALELLSSYPWPGNYRELKFCIEQLLNEYPEASSIQAGHLRFSDAMNRHSGDIENDLTQQLKGLLERAMTLDEVKASLALQGALLAKLIEESFELTRQPQVGSSKEYSVARAMALLRNIPSQSGPEPKRFLGRLLKIIAEINPDAHQNLKGKPFYD